MIHLAVEEIEQLLFQSAEETLRTHALAGQVARSVPSHATDDEWVVATVGFVADGQDGRLTVLCPRRVVRRLQPPGAAPGDGVSETSERDVLGELANMLIGRFKHQLIARGTPITIMTPSTGIARDMRPHADGPFPTCQVVALGNDRIFLHLQTSPDGSARPLPRQWSPVDEPVAAEGELLLF